jgi:hypothetical protein
LKWLQIGATRVNLSNLWLGSWDYDNFIERKEKKNYEVFLSNLILKDKITKKNIN